MRITKLDGMRGILALAIVLLHYEGKYLPDAVYNNFLVRESFIAVDFFFVLSGFVITYNYNYVHTKLELKDYLKKRFARLYPLLVFSTSLTLLYFIMSYYVVPLVLPSLSELGTTENMSVRALANGYIEALLFTNSTPILGTSLGLNDASWSISSEMISYIVFGVISLYAGLRKGRALAIVIFLCAVFCIWRGEFFFSGNYGFVRGLMAFSLGYFVWVISQRKFVMNNSLELLMIAGVIVIPYLLHFGFEGITREMFGMVTVPLFFAACILLLLKSNGWISKMLDTRPIQFLGRVSYSIYLNHLLVISIVPTMFYKVLKIHRTGVAEILILLLAVTLVVIYSAFTYEYIEVRGGKLLKKWLLKARPHKVIITPQ